MLNCNLCIFSRMCEDPWRNIQNNKMERVLLSKVFYILYFVLTWCLCLSSTLCFANSSSESIPLGAKSSVESLILLLSCDSLELKLDELSLSVSASFWAIWCWLSLSPVAESMSEVGTGGWRGETGCSYRVSFVMAWTHTGKSLNSSQPSFHWDS